MADVVSTIKKVLEQIDVNLQLVDVEGDSTDSHAH